MEKDIVAGLHPSPTARFDAAGNHTFENIIGKRIFIASNF